MLLPNKSTFIGISFLLTTSWGCHEAKTNATQQLEDKKPTTENDASKTEEAIPPKQTEKERLEELNYSIKEERKELRRLMRPGTRTMVYEKPTKTNFRNEAALCNDCDVILITVCSLRKDHVGVYGHKPTPTPHTDRLAKNGYYFDKAYSASNFTLAGLTAILTGRFGISTGVISYATGLAKDIFTLPQVLSYYGYNTAAFTIDAGSGFRPEHGLDRGFLWMEITPAPRSTPEGRWRDPFAKVDRRGDGASAKPVAAWLQQQPVDKPLFAMFHSRTAHYPFVISSVGADEDKTGMTKALWNVGKSSNHQVSESRSRTSYGKTKGRSVGLTDPVQSTVLENGEPAVKVMRKHYLEAVSRMDKDIGVLIEAQKKRGRADKTMWVLVADHGESLNDHDELLHGAAFYETVINVPLIINVPGLKGKKKAQKELVSHVDILPTILDVVGAVPPANIDGVSMIPLLQGKTDSIRKMSLAVGGAAPPKGELPGVVISPPWALLMHEGGCDDKNNYKPRSTPNENLRCLYNLDKNPEQNEILTKKNPGKVAELNKIWKYFVHTRSRKGIKVDLDPDFVEKLRTSGYDFR